MSIYDHCLELNTALPADPSLEETSEELTVQTETAISTVPALLRKQDHGFSSATVYYITMPKKTSVPIPESSNI